MSLSVFAEAETVPDWKTQRVEKHPAIIGGYKSLICAIVLQACKDAVGCNPEAQRARGWLLSEEGEFYLHLTGINQTAVVKWVQARAPIPVKAKAPVQPKPARKSLKGRKFGEREKKKACTCLYCGAEFMAANYGNRFCSNAHRGAYYRSQKRLQDTAASL